MNGVHPNSKPRRLDKPVLQGCLGRMVNLFDLPSSKSNNLLTDKPHYDGSSLSRSRSDISRMSNFTGNEMQDELILSEEKWSSPSKKPHVTPVKMLLAQEMSKELASKQNSPNVVARLMGLDVLPQNQPAHRTHSRSYSQNSYSENYWQEENEFTDIYEIWHQSEGRKCVRDKSPKKSLCSEDVNEKKLALIRSKFMEAKQLASDEKLRETKEFRDALDVLSSNGDLFLKVFQEPNSILSHLLNRGKVIPPPPEIKRITVLKPSKNVVDDKFAVNSWDNHNGFSPTMSTWKDDDSPSQPTRIVLLKPSATKFSDAKTVAISEDEEAREAREVAKEITQRMRESLASHRRDETLLSSACSNGYIGDESSIEKSENESATGNLSDSEVMSPTSRNSWDYGNRYGSPYSTSVSRASYSPESSVCREAKRRLSERWTMMSSSRGSQEQRKFQKSSSTLGEMLAISEVLKPEICKEDKNTDQDVSPRSLLRSKSVPVSSTAYGERLNVEVSNQALLKEDVSKDTKMKGSKTSFAEKVTSLLFSRSKKPKKEKFSSKPQSNDESELVFSPAPQLHSRKGDPYDKRHEQGICYQQGGLSVSQPGSLGESEEKPCPISVLEPPFEEGKSHMRVFLSRSNLIDKSPSIGSLSRTLSFDECFSPELATSISPFSPFISREANNDVEVEWQSLVQSLLTMAGLNNDDYGPNFAKWHSLESPLDPSLREKYIDLTAKEPLHEAKRRKLRSTQKLVFDCVNTVLVDMTGVRTTESRLADSVWARAKEWVSGHIRCPMEDDDVDGDSASLVEREVWQEMMGKGWDDQISIEVEIIGKEIEGKLLKELVEESLVECSIFTH